MVKEIQLLFPNAVIGEDIIFQNDSEGDYIKEWNLAEPQPSQVDIDGATSTVLLQDAIKHFESVTTQFIEGKVQAYNLSNGLAFNNIDAFSKYAINVSSPHYAIANRFIVYADNVWEAVRAYQSTLTAIPTDAELKAVLDGVTF